MPKKPAFATSVSGLPWWVRMEADGATREEIDAVQREREASASLQKSAPGSRQAAEIARGLEDPVNHQESRRHTEPNQGDRPMSTAKQHAANLDRIARRGPLTIPAPGTMDAPAGLLDLSPEETRGFSLCRAIDEAAVDGKKEEDAALERDVSRRLKREATGLGAGEGKGRMMIPFGALGLRQTTTGQGAAMVFDQLGPHVELHRERPALASLGATILPVGSAPLVVTLETGELDVYWVDELPGSAPEESTPRFRRIEAKPRTLTGTLTFSRTLLAAGRNNPDVDRIVRAQLAAAAAAEWDRVGLAGSGTGPEPLGLRNHPELRSLAANGDALGWEEAVDMETAVAQTGISLSSPGYISTPGVRGRAKKTERVNGSGSFVWGGDFVNGHPALATTRLVQESEDRHPAIFGDWSDLWVILFGGLDIISDPYTLKKKGLVQLTFFQYLDIHVMRPESFIQRTNLLPDEVALAS